MTDRVALDAAVLCPFGFAGAASADTTLGITSQPSGSGPGIGNSTTTYAQAAQDPSTRTLSRREAG